MGHGRFLIHRWKEVRFPIISTSRQGCFWLRAQDYFLLFEKNMFYKPPGFHTRWFFNKITKIFIKDGFSIKMFLLPGTSLNVDLARLVQESQRSGILATGDLVLSWHGQRGRPLLHAMKLQWMVITPGKPIYFWPFIGVISLHYTPLITGRGPTLWEICN